MSGCNGKRKDDRGVCGGGRRQVKSTERSSHTRKTLNGYLFYVVSRKQASYYNITTKFVVNHIKKTFD